jgi:hypothetical protein
LGGVDPPVDAPIDMPVENEADVDADADADAEEELDDSDFEAASVARSLSLLWSEIHRPTCARTRCWAFFRSVSDEGRALTK